MTTLETAPVRAGRREPPLRVAVIGGGWVSREVWVPLLAEHDAFEVAAVVDPDPSAARETAREAHEEHPALLPRPEDVDPGAVDAAIIALPNHLHLPTARALLERDIPVFIEKPVARTLTEAQEMALAGLADHDGLVPGARMLAWSAARHRGDVMALEQIVPSLGRLRGVRLSWRRAAGIPQRTGWFTDRSLAGGGSLLDLGWHLLDVGLHLLGWPRVVRSTGVLSADWMGNPEATADWSRRTGGQGSARDGDHQPVEDTAHGLLVTDDGVGVWVETRWASHEPHDVTEISVEGTEGVATLRGTFGFSPHREPSTLTVLRHGHEEHVVLPDEPVGIEYRRQVDVLARVLRDPAGSVEHEASIPGVLTIASAIDQIYNSARKGVMG